MTKKRNILRNLLSALFVLCSGSFTGVAQTTPDPGIAGPYAVSKLEYNFGDLAFTPPPAAAFPDNIEVIGSVHYPTDLSHGPYPVLLFLHGRHVTCWQTSDSSVALEWPCPTGWQSVTSYEGYYYLANNMASHGYIVISISANAISAIDNSLPDLGMNARAVLVQHHLDLWNAWNTVGGAPFDSLFIGKLNMQNIGTMGHSRGGEGVIYHAQYNASLGSPYGIKAVLTLAPIDYNRHVLNGIPLMDVSPYCDGDVSDLEGVHFYDDARYNDTSDEAPKHTILFTGADHDFFNTVWTPYLYPGGADDWLYYFSDTAAFCGASAPGSGRFDTTTQQAALTAYLAAFYRIYIGNETQFNPILQVSDIVPPASSMIGSSQIFVSYHPARVDRLDVNRTDNLTTYTTNTLSGNVTETGLVSSAICGGGLTMAVCDPGLSSDQLPHGGTAGTAGLGQMRMQWNDRTEWYQNALPVAYENLTPYQSLQFRATVDFVETATDSNLNFTVSLIDLAGDTSSQVVTNHSQALFYQQGTEPTDLPKEVFNTISIPLSSFTGINESKVRYIRFKFDKVSAGAVMISDLAFTNPLCGNFTALFSDSVTRVSLKAFFTNKSTSYDKDSLTWKWNFGDPASGVNDTSTQKNPFHIYPHSGTFNPCLYVTSYRKNGLVCMDSFCTSVHVATVGVPVINENKITIIPNPAKDYIQINGAANTDVLTLIDLYGQVVLTATLTQPIVQLPQSFPTGVYYAIITTGSGRIYNKLLIAR